MPTFYDSNNVNAIIIGTARFWFSDGATTAAMARGIGYGYKDIGNITKLTMKPEVERKKIMGSYRGKKRLDKTVITKSEITYELETDEMNLFNLSLVFGTADTTDHTQSIQTAANADELTFTSPIPSDSSKWYALTVSGARIINLTACTLSGKVEGTDFVVDYARGFVRFLTAFATATVMVITAPAIVAAGAANYQGLTPMQTLSKTGYGWMEIFDQDTNALVAAHTAFLCTLTCEEGFEMDGDTESKLKIKVEVNGTDPGTLFGRYNLTRT